MDLPSRGLQGMSARLQNVVMDLRGELATLADWRVNGSTANVGSRDDESSLTRRTTSRSSAPSPPDRSRRLPDPLPTICSLSCRATSISLLKRLCCRAKAGDARATELCSLSIRFSRTSTGVRVVARPIAASCTIVSGSTGISSGSPSARVHAALLATLGVDAELLRLAESILDGYAERYASYPNVDNVLGSDASVLQHVSRVDLAASDLRRDRSPRRR